MITPLEIFDNHIFTLLKQEEDAIDNALKRAVLQEDGSYRHRFVISGGNDISPENSFIKQRAKKLQEEFSSLARKYGECGWQISPDCLEFAPEHKNLVCQVVFSTSKFK